MHHSLSPGLNPPRADRRDHVLQAHGQKRTDPYHWLRDDSRTDPKVLAYLHAENTYTQACMAPIAPTREALYSEITARISPVDQSAPLEIDGYCYYSRYAAGQEYPVYARRRGSMTAPESLLLDVNELARDADYCDVAHTSMSRDQRILAIAHDNNGRRLFSLRFRDVSTNTWLADEIHGASAALAWAGDNRTVYYVRKHPDTLLPYQVYRHRLGTTQTVDVLVFEELDPSFHTHVYRSPSREFLFIASHSTNASEIRWLRADDPEGEFQVFYPRQLQHEYSVTHLGGRFFVRSNWDAENFRLLETTLAESLQRSKWREIIPHRDDVLLVDIAPFEEFLVLEERCNGLNALRVKSWDTTRDWKVETDDTVYDIALLENPNPASHQLRYHYESLTTPATTYQLDMRTGRRSLLKRTPILGGYDPADYRSERIWVRSEDGADIPCSIARHKDTSIDGTAPAYVYAYGSYGYSIDATFSSARISLLQRGFVFAIAHVRGGQEMGRSWYEAGRGLRKWNTYLDFIAVSEALGKRGYADPERIFAVGGSAGGKLMAVVANERPDLYKGIVAHVPFVDVVTTMLDDSIPLTTGEYDEWGNPNRLRDYAYMLSYSPYDQVRAQDYPHMLVTAGLHDSQVQYWEPAKWVARLRELRTDVHHLLLHTNMDSGHSGESGRFRRHRETAMEYAFILSLAGLAPEMLPVQDPGES